MSPYEWVVERAGVVFSDVLVGVQRSVLASTAGEFLPQFDGPCPLDPRRTQFRRVHGFRFLSLDAPRELI